MLLILILSTFLNCKEFSVFYVKKEFDLGIQNNLKKDYYINMGSKDGLKKDAVLNVYRKNQVIDNNSENRIIQTKIFVAKIKVLFVGNDFSIARLESLSDLEKNPIAGYVDIMIGDVIELNTNKITSHNTFKIINNNEFKKSSFFTSIIKFFNKII